MSNVEPANCEACGQPQDELTRWGGQDWCTDCLESTTFECENCGDRYHRDERHRWERRDLCESCVNDLSFYCDQCDERHNSDERCPNQSSEVYYGYDGPWMLHRAEAEPPQPDLLYMGAELEMEVTDPETRYEVSQGLNTPWCYTKDDGSLACGIELVTHPFSWKWLQEHAEDLQKVLRRALRDCNAEESCGMHVHMSRDAFRPLHLYRMLKLMYGNPTIFARVSGRTGEALRTWATLWDTDTPIGRKVTGRDKGRRYNAINMLPPKTIELRLFRGTLNFKRVMANLSVCASMWDFTKQHPLSLVTYPEYYKFVTTQPQYAAALFLLPTT